MTVGRLICSAVYNVAAAEAAVRDCEQLAIALLSASVGLLRQRIQLDARGTIRVQDSKHVLVEMYEVKKRNVGELKRDVVLRLFVQM